MTCEVLLVCNGCQKPKLQTSEHFSPRKNPGGSLAFKQPCRECRRIADRERERNGKAHGVGKGPKERAFTASSKICSLCANQSWRVVGPRCRNPDCKLLYKDEPAAELVTHRHFERAV